MVRKDLARDSGLLRVVEMRFPSMGWGGCSSNLNLAREAAARALHALEPPQFGHRNHRLAAGALDIGEGGLLEQRSPAQRDDKHGSHGGGQRRRGNAASASTTTFLIE